MKKINIDHVNFTVNNLKESLKWYETVFDFKLVEDGMKVDGKAWGIIQNGETMLCLSESKGRDFSQEQETHRIYHFGFRMEKDKIVEALVQENSLETYYESPVNYPNSKSWYVKDPTGHTIEISVWNKNKISFE